MKYLKEFKELFEGGDPEKKYDMRVNRFHDTYFMFE